MKNIQFVKISDSNLSTIKKLDYSNNTDYIIINSNLDINLDYDKIYNKHKNDNNTITMVCGIKNIKIPYDVVEIDKLGMIEYFEETPSFTFTVNLGVYVINSDIIPLIKDCNDELSLRKILNISAKNKKKIGTFIYGGSI